MFIPRFSCVSILFHETVKYETTSSARACIMCLKTVNLEILLCTLVNIVSLLLKIHKLTLPKDTTNHILVENSTVLWHWIRWNKPVQIHKYPHPYKMISCANHEERSYRTILLILWPATLSTLFGAAFNVLSVHPKWYDNTLEIPQNG